jgi:hypothetical protein
MGIPKESQPWQPDDDDAPWTPERDAEEPGEVAAEEIEAGYSPEEFDRIDRRDFDERPLENTCSSLPPGVDPYRFHLHSSRQLWSEFVGFIADEVGAEFRPGCDGREFGFGGSAVEQRAQARRFLVDVGVRVFDGIEQLALTAGVSALAIRRVLASTKSTDLVHVPVGLLPSYWRKEQRQRESTRQQLAPRHRFGASQARAVARAIWAARAVAPFSHYQRFLEIVLRSLRRLGDRPTRLALAELDAGSERHTAAALAGSLQVRCRENSDA